MSRAPIDMSLRLWSDDIALSPYLHPLGPSDIVHVRGAPVPPSRGATPRIAPRHYASIAHEQTSRSGDVDVWLRSLLVKMRGTSLGSLIESRRIDGTFWIAILGSIFRPMPTIDPRLVETATSMRLSVLLENYTELRDGNPSRSWLVKEGAPGADVAGSRA